MVNETEQTTDTFAKFCLELIQNVWTQNLGWPFTALSCYSYILTSVGSDRFGYDFYSTCC